MPGLHGIERIVSDPDYLFFHAGFANDFVHILQRFLGQSFIAAPVDLELKHEYQVGSFGCKESLFECRDLVANINPIVVEPIVLHFVPVVVDEAISLGWAIVAEIAGGVVVADHNDVVPGNLKVNFDVGCPDLVGIEDGRN